MNWTTKKCLFCFCLHDYLYQRSNKRNVNILYVYCEVFLRLFIYFAMFCHTTDCGDWSHLDPRIGAAFTFLLQGNIPFTPRRRNLYFSLRIPFMCQDKNRVFFMFHWKGALPLESVQYIAEYCFLLFKSFLNFLTGGAALAQNLKFVIWFPSQLSQFSL